MSFDLCTVKTAEHPFYIESVGVSIYSIEELCFFLKENLYLIDKSIMNSSLCDWVRDELGLKTLSRKMSEAMERPDKDVSYFIMPVFAEIGYLSGKGLHALREDTSVISKMECMTSALTRNSSPSSLGAQFYASVWNNLGCAYALQFRYRNAADCFLSAWKLVRSREMMRKYVSTLPLFLDEKEYRDTLESLGADPVLIEKIQEYNLKIAADARDRLRARPQGKLTDEEVLTQMEEEYRRGAFA